MSGDFRTMIKEMGWRRAITFKYESSRLNYYLTSHPPFTCCWLNRHHYFLVENQEYEDIYTYWERHIECIKPACELYIPAFSGLSLNEDHWKDIYKDFRQKYHFVGGIRRGARGVEEYKL